MSRDTSLSESDLKDIDKVEQLESERAGVFEIIRATVPTTRLPAIRGIEDPKKAYKLLVEQVSQDDGLEVAALIAKVATTRFSGSESVTSFLEGINDLHTQLAEATADNDDLKISDKLLAVFLLLSFPGEQFSTIRDQLFGDLKNLNTSKVMSRLRTKSALTSVDESAVAMSTTARPTNTGQARLISPRTDKSPNAPCVLKEHWGYPHTNGVCSKQQHNRPGNQSRPFNPQPVKSTNTLSDEEKVRRFNQLAAAGVIGFNTEADQN